MDDLRALATELAVLVIAASVLGLLAGLILGWAAGRAVGRVVDPEPAPTPERILVRPDPQLYLENEALRDEVAELQLRVDGLRADVAAARARRPVAPSGRRPEGAARAAAGSRVPTEPTPTRPAPRGSVIPTGRVTPVPADGRDAVPPATTPAGRIDPPAPEPRVRPTPVIAASPTSTPAAEAVGSSNRRRAAWRRRG